MIKKILVIIPELRFIIRNYYLIKELLCSILWFILCFLTVNFLFILFFGPIVPHLYSS